MNRRVLGLSKTLCFVSVLQDDERYVNNGQGNDQHCGVKNEAHDFLVMQNGKKK